jgi:Family of unknown function (DUF5331)
VDTEHLRASLKTLWLDYYRSNRQWLNRLGVWVTCEGERRPSSSFILATLAILEPKLHDILPLIVDLSSNPDRIVLALGLNFNPEDALEAAKDAANITENSVNSVKMLPSSQVEAVTEVVEKKAIADDYYPKDRRYKRRD